jgi:hypothetical protein
MLKAPGDPVERLYLTASVPFGKRYPGFRYSPSTGLFKSLAAIEPQQDQILEFAGRWGMLTAGTFISLENKAMGVGEPLDLWRSEAADLSLAVRLWDLIKSGDLAGLSQYIKWKDSSGVMFERLADVPWLQGVDDNFQEGRWIAAREINPELLETFQVGDLIRPAWHQLQYIVNEKLAGNASARLLWNGSKTRLSLHQVPKDLTSALWLQLARAIEGDREYVQCQECRNWFEVSSPDGGRKDKRFCSTACRARFWRKTNKGEEDKKK